MRPSDLRVRKCQYPSHKKGEEIEERGKSEDGRRNQSWRVFLVAKKRTRTVTVIKEPKRTRTETVILESTNKEEGQEEHLSEHQFL